MAKPFLNWVGGKTPIIELLLQNIPKKFKNYYEPFIGSGKLLLTIEPNQKIVINDINTQLVNTYEVIKNYPQQLIENLIPFEGKNTESEYYTYRDIYNEQPNSNETNKINQAAIFLYLMHANYRGLYRVNKKGKFNVPYGNRPKCEFRIDYKNILDISKLLNNNSEIMCGNFVDALTLCEKEDFVYLDPPYYNSYNQYDKNKFDEADFKELKRIFVELTERECFVLLSNSDDPYIIDMFKEYEIAYINTTNNITAKSEKPNKESKRGEVLIKNY